jgi:hypothetical protein
MREPNPVRSIRFLVVLLGASIAAGSPARAQAQDFRYCLAVFDRAKRVIVSNIYFTGEPIDKQEQAFSALLLDLGKPFDRTLCPRAADREAAGRDRNWAIRYNAGRGYTAEFVEWRNGL